MYVSDFWVSFFPSLLALPPHFLKFFPNEWHSIKAWLIVIMGLLILSFYFFFSCFMFFDFWLPFISNGIDSEKEWNYKRGGGCSNNGGPFRWTTLLQDNCQCFHSVHWGWWFWWFGSRVRLQHRTHFAYWPSLFEDWWSYWGRFMFHCLWRTVGFFISLFLTWVLLFSCWVSHIMPYGSTLGLPLFIRLCFDLILV